MPIKNKPYTPYKNAQELIQPSTVESIKYKYTKEEMLALRDSPLSRDSLLSKKIPDGALRRQEPPSALSAMPKKRKRRR